MGRKVIAHISESALRHNVAQVRRFAPRSKMIAMVKANAYGHGLVPIAKALEGQVEAMGVASIDEALLLREAGILTDIVLIEGFFREEELALIQAHRLTLVIHHWPQVEALLAYQRSDQPFRIWLKVNTGMNRLGFSPQAFEAAYEVLFHHRGVQLIGFMTHFAQADEKENDFTQQQIEKFHQRVGNKIGDKCLANSAGILAWSQAHADWVRPGLMLYGASPFADVPAASFDLRPVMSLCSEIIAVRELEPGEQVGYGGLWKNTSSRCKIGIVAAGYGDGYPLFAKNGGPVLVNQCRVPIVGKVSMDMLAVDVSSLEVKVGDPVTLWGEGLPIEEVAQHADTVAYELFCRFTQRVPMRIVS